MAETVDRLQDRVERERHRRHEAEAIAEEATRDLYERQRELEELATTLEQRVEERTRELERRLDQQSTLAETSRRALEGIELDELVVELCESTAEALGVDHCEVFELRETTEELVLRAGVGWPDPANGEKTVPIDPGCQTGYTLRRREPTVVKDVHADPRFESVDLLDQQGLRSGITVVVPGPEDPWGIFGVHSRRPRAFDENDASFVQSMGNVLSQAIHRERSRRRLKRYAGEMERANEELERANEELEEFAHLVSHDLREPVRMVTSYMGLLEARYADDLDEDAVEMVEYARDGAERVHTMIRGLLRYARVDREGLDTRAVDADEVLDDVLRSLSVQIEDSGAEIERQPLPTVEADPTQLGHVFQNLISNGIKFAEPGRPPRISIRAEETEGGWRFVVEDEGIGMDADEAEDVFEMFQQGGGAERKGGHGIGLAVCQRIVERHGGSIAVDTARGEGSSFHFTLPDASTGGSSHGD